MSSYKLTFNGRVATAPNWAGYVSYPQPDAKPYIVFRFEEGISPRPLHTVGTWKQVETSQYNDWKWSCEAYPDQYDVYNGWQFAFSTSNGDAYLKYSKLGGIEIIGWGNLDTIETTDRMFYNCDAIVNVPNIFVNGFVDGVLEDCASMFNGCTRMNRRTRTRII